VPVIPQRYAPLLKKHGADKLSEINPAKYEALLQDAEVIGNGS